MSFSSATKQQLGYYVYGLVDPRTNEIFYVGKASSNNRAYDHLAQASNDSEKSLRIEEIRQTGIDPRVDILRYGLDEHSVLDVEAAIIDTLGLENLTNAVRGHGVERGRMTAEDVERLYGAPSVPLEDVKEAAILFFIKNTYSPTQDHIERYDSVRQFWKIGEERRTPDPATGELPYKLALAIVDSVVVGAYRIAAWFPAGTTVSTRASSHPDESNGQWEFVGQELDQHPLLGRRLYKDGSKLKAVQVGFTYHPH
ncbi:LEM-3-like GIY-YIG domain-containing protein [Kerstersia gyiorum]|uniref:LEM-3-like GIY-YIG domain-containing protein n=1 Tax=Kerstersia gyiorum TaxID=206506 RepID=UPI003B431467